jgi:hypothetical protein
LRSVSVMTAASIRLSYAGYRNSWTAFLPYSTAEESPTVWEWLFPSRKFEPKEK